MTTRTTTFQRTFGITCAFAFATAICGLLLGARRCFAECFDVGGLFGNLLLAWIPYVLALAGCSASSSLKPSYGCVWRLTRPHRPTQFRRD